MKYEGSVLRKDLLKTTKLIKILSNNDFFKGSVTGPPPKTYMHDSKTIMSMCLLERNKVTAQESRLPRKYMYVVFKR